MNFPSPERHDEFWLRLKTLLSEFPEIEGRMAREYAERPDDDVWRGDRGEQFNPDSPVLLEGVLIVVAHRSLDGWNDISVLSPAEQSGVIDRGLAASASRAF